MRICIARRRQLRRASAEELVVNDAWSRGVVVVASAGNDGSNYGAPHYPSGHTNAIAVGTTSEDATRGSTFNAGEWVEVAAPGRYIYSTLPSRRTSREISLFAELRIQERHEHGRPVRLGLSRAALESKTVDLGRPDKNGYSATGG